jgi:hypothetical protein
VTAILLGPQRRPTVGAVVRAMPGDRRFATITAGWQEREADDSELTALLSGRAVNLSLHRRWLDVQDSDPDYAADERLLQRTLTELQDIYLLRLDYALQAVYALQRHSGQDWLLAGGVTEAIAAVRELDAAHLHRINEARGEFFRRWQPHDRPAIAGHRAAVAAILADSAGLIVAGGHVGVLADVLHLFNVAAALRSQAPGWPVIAWSAGAMALADRIALFGDRSPQGPGHPEIYGSGLSVLREVILLPHARTRLLLQDTPRMAVLARRFAPARCILLDNGTRLDQGSDGTWPPGTRVLAEDGHVTALEAA